ncbi:MAG: hypothetical protein Q7K26_06655 [bacterium]|nr:hypothetical protein [bacterium]
MKMKKIQAGIETEVAEAELGEMIKSQLPDISEAAQNLLKKASGCASPLDKRGNWIDSGLIREFGMAAVDELVRADLITHTGSPGMGYIDVIRAKPKT